MQRTPGNEWPGMPASDMESVLISLLVEEHLSIMGMPCDLAMLTGAHNRMLVIDVHACRARWVFRIAMPNQVRIDLIDKLADAEYRLAFGTSEKLQLGAVVAAFCQAREGIVAAAK